jgi:tripartite-type tricarboxylate transporter receptor subunit TctC
MNDAETTGMERTSTRRLALFGGALCVATALWAPAHAEPAFPSGPLKIVNAFPPGGPSDIISRLLADKLHGSLKQPVIVENKPGAGGDVAADQVAKAPADGYTILTGIDTTFTVNPSIYRSIPFKPEDLKPLMILASSGLMVAVHPSLGVKTLAELVAKGKTQTLSFSSGSNGSPGHLAAAIFGDAAGIKVLHVPYKGNSPAVMALLSGEVQAGILATPGLLPHVQAGKITALAVTSRERSLIAPDLPTVAEAGVKELEVEVLYLAMVPAATPEPVVAVLQKAMADALQEPDVKAQLAKLDLFVEAQVGKAAQDRIAAQRARYARIIKATGMKIE